MFNLLLIDDDEASQSTLMSSLSAQGYQVLMANDAHNASHILAQVNIDLILADTQASQLGQLSMMQWLKARGLQIPTIFLDKQGSVREAIRAIRAGASDYFLKPCDPAELMTAVQRYAISHPVGLGAETKMIAIDEVSLTLLNMTRRVAATNVAVMIGGPSGVGKEVVAQYIHEYSGRTGPFVAINCAAIPENMLEAMLFGYEKGAFTGAYQGMPGKFEQAQGGTLMLDEISEMDLGLQAKLLRVIQEKEVERLGGRKQIQLDVRLIATSNRRLKEEVAAGRFREDLYYRLSVFPLFLNPLRDRPEDILPLVSHFLNQFKQPQDVTPVLTVEARNALLHYAWPGNVRELENVVQRALIMKVGDQITQDDLHFEDDITSTARHEEMQSALSEGLKSTEAQMICDVLKIQSTRKAAAQHLGISQRTLRYKIAKMRDSGIAIPN